MLIYEAERSDRRGYLYCQRDHNFICTTAMNF